MELIAFLLLLPFLIFGGCHFVQVIGDKKMHEEYHHARYQSVYQCEGPGICEFVCIHSRRRTTCSKCEEVQAYAIPNKERINQYRQQQQNNTVIINGHLYVERVVDDEVMYVRVKEPVRHYNNRNVINGAAVQVMQHMNMPSSANPMSPHIAF